MADSRTYKIALIEGDGIGPELVQSATTILDALGARYGFSLTYTTFLGGAGAFMRHGSNLEYGALGRLQAGEFAALMKGPVGLPEVRLSDGTEAGLLGGVLRGGLDTYANVRPIVLYPGTSAPVSHPTGSIRYQIVRESTEGLYLSRGLGVGNSHAMVDQLFVSRKGTERVARFAFELARKSSGAPQDGVRRVTVVDKSNVLRSYALFREVVEETAVAYPDVELGFRYSDAAAHDLVLNPSQFDIVLTENFLGDILSELGAATVGGVGMCGSGCYGESGAYFEPVHGSAPTIAGKNKANPLSQLFCAGMMLDYIGEAEAARSLHKGIDIGLRDDPLSIDPYGHPTTGTEGFTAGLLDLVHSL